MAQTGAVTLTAYGANEANGANGANGEDGITEGRKGGGSELKLREQDEAQDEDFAAEPQSTGENLVGGIWWSERFFVYLQHQTNIERPMANMYIRVPHYVASFYRNRDQHHPKKVSDPVDMENEPVLWDMLMHYIAPNPYEKIVKEGCFCERMWRKMMRGQRLDGSNTRVKRNRQDPLTDTEVRDLCQLPAAKNEESDEYLCIALPEYIFRDGKQHVVDGQYQLPTYACRLFLAEMRRRFWAECIGYIDSFIEVDKQMGYDRNMMEGMDRFMIRYDIQSGDNNKYRKTMKRNYYRQLKYQQHRQYDFVEHGEF